MNSSAHLNEITSKSEVSQSSVLTNLSLVDRTSVQWKVFIKASRLSPKPIQVNLINAKIMKFCNNYHYLGLKYLRINLIFPFSDGFHKKLTSFHKNLSTQ